MYVYHLNLRSNSMKSYYYFHFSNKEQRSKEIKTLTKEQNLDSNPILTLKWQNVDHYTSTNMHSCLAKTQENNAKSSWSLTFFSKFLWNTGGGESDTAKTNRIQKSTVQGIFTHLA